MLPPAPARYSPTVRQVEPLAEADMVAAFLRAELHSERFGEKVRAAMRRLAVPSEAIEHPDVSDAHQNTQRLAILRHYRRYGQTNSLFDGFPSGAVFHEMIAVSAGPDSPLVALEGHLRLTVYALRPDRLPNPLTIVLGTASRMPEWGCY